MPGRNKNNDRRFGVKINQSSEPRQQPLTFGSKNYYEPLKSYDYSQTEKITDSYSLVPNIHHFDYDSNYDYSDTNEKVSKYVPITSADTNKEDTKEKVIKVHASDDGLLNDSGNKNVLPSYGQNIPEKIEANDSDNFEFPSELGNYNDNTPNLPKLSTIEDFSSYDYDSLGTYGNKIVDNLPNYAIATEELLSDELGSYKNETNIKNNDLNKQIPNINPLSSYARQIESSDNERVPKFQRLVQDINNNDQGVY